MKTYSIIPYLDGLKAKTTLIHGCDDKVIPPSESMILYSRLKTLGIDCRLEITPLISHGASSFTPGVVPKAFSLIGAFAHFFKNATD